MTTTLTSMIVNKANKPVCRLLCFFSLVLVSSCSNKLAYNYLDWAIMWEVNKYVDLNHNQKKIVNTAIDEFHFWHRHTQLSQYAEFFKRAKPILLNNPNASQLHAFTDDMQIFIDNSLVKLIPTIIDITQTLDDKQVEQILKKVDKDNKKFNKKYVDIPIEKLYKIRQKQIGKHLKRLVGSLTNEQKQWLIAWSESLAHHEPLMLDQQYTFRNDYENILQTRTDLNKTTTGINNLMLYKSDDWAPKLRKKIDINQAKTFGFLEKVFQNLTPEQTLKMEKTLDKYIDMFEDLANK